MVDDSLTPQCVDPVESRRLKADEGTAIVARDVALMVVGAIVGTVLSVVGAVLFEDPFRKRAENVRKWRLRRRGRKEIVRSSEGLATYEDTFAFGPLKTTILIVDGNGDTPFRMGNIEIRVSPQFITFPSELKGIKKEIERREAKKKQAGLQHLWNGANYAVKSFSVTRTGLTEESEVCLGLQSSDYYTFLASKEALDKYIPKYGKTVRQQYLEPFFWNRPVPFLSNSFGVNVALVTADDQLIVCRRSDVVGSRPSEYTVSANEGLSRGIDDQGGTHPPDLYACGYRALEEELGVQRWDVERLEILAFVVDLQWHQWGCLSLAKLGDLTYEELRNRYNRATKDKFEHALLDSVAFTPEAVARYVLDPRRRSNWYGGAPASFYLALVLSYGRNAVEHAIKEAVNHKWT